jgi:hypothetical protein
MVGRLPRRGRAVVATAALPDHLAVINAIYRAECTGIVAIFADVGRLNMAWRFADSCGPVVTAEAVSADSRVVKACPRKAVVAVA